MKQNKVDIVDGGLYDGVVLEDEMWFDFRHI